ncbi:protease inhibitor I42 family protein [Candidatus Chloroploca sp. M-50]|uniref:Protease inhibitor I42 family protein n=1 Tax=Candidatus Chloroploca mongolica TaxID=2528176 RepID=A0ABS4DAU7_9CHLR|nr:protease inhibitor I42 family protein [Candidatus Chloroploca mongolica]MBP1466566.1 protease inhibitor I42 family protein [Candidatus Chloroploca mongolica]
MHRTQRLVFVIVLLLSLAACAQPQPPLPEVQLTDDAVGQTVELAVGQALAITLPSNPSTGYGWQFIAGDEAIIAQQGEAEYVQGASMPGAGGMETLRFMAQGAGTTMLTIGYKRPFEPDEMPVRSFTVEVVVR